MRDEARLSGLLPTEGERMQGMGTKRRLTVFAAVVFGGLMLWAASAAAMDCVVVNRSVQGALHASSNNWAVVTTADIVGACWGGQGEATAEAAIEAAGLPTVFTTRTNKVLPDNGHGIVHIDNEYIGVLIGALGPPTTPDNCHG
jgi:hypothetical protein